MGFTILGDENFIRKPINISDLAWDIIDADLEEFFSNETKSTYSTILNIIFKNFYDSANASVCLMLKEYKQNLQTKLNGINNSEVIERLIELEKARLLKIICDNKKPSKDNDRKKRKIRIDFSCTELLAESTEKETYDDEIHHYTNAIFEEYARLPHCEREKIINKDNFDEFINAMQLQKKVRITKTPYFNVKENKTIYTTYFFSPFEIINDEHLNYTYIIGESEDIDGNNKKIVSFRLTKIDKVKVYTSKSFHFSKLDIEKINKIKEKGISFMASDLEEIVVMFNKKGIEEYNNIKHMRPNAIKKEENIYTFNCSLTQARNYFFKLGSNAVILSPKSLRDDFIKKYKRAIKEYEKSNEI